MNKDQIDLVTALRTVSDELADHVERLFQCNASFDDVQAQLRRAFAVVDGWRIGRGV